MSEMKNFTQHAETTITIRSGTIIDLESGEKLLVHYIVGPPDVKHIETTRAVRKEQLKSIEEVFDKSAQDTILIAGYWA